MPRYIDADEFVKRVIQYPRQSTKTIGLALADTPTADVVEVVRCKDCKHGREYKHTKEYVECKVDCEPIDRDSDFYCKYGERRDNECTDQRL